MKKKIIVLGLLSSMIVGTIAGCGSSNTNTVTSSTENSNNMETTEDATVEESSDASEEITVEDDSDTASDSKVLVVYYSASGNTAQVADYIAEETSADTFELVPEEIYTDADLNWTDRDSRVSREHDDESLRNVSLVNATPDNWDDYDVVFVGYPIWWGIAAWPVNQFITSNDFSGKTVIPFCTFSSSGLGQSGELLEDMAQTGEWMEGQRFSSGASKEDVTNWVEGLSF